MGLPSKKQLHKHKRGTRKALDTLDAMDEVKNDKGDDPGVEKLVKTKKTKKETSSEKKKNKSKKSAKKNTKATEIKRSAEHYDPTGAQGNDPGTITEAQLSQKEPDEEAPKSIDLSDLEEMPKTKANDKDQESIDPEDLEAASSIKTSDAEAQPVSADSKSDSGADMVESKMNLGEQLESNAPMKDNVKVVKVEDDVMLSSDSDDDEFEDTQKDKYLTFRIGDESFGFAIQYVTEIIVIHKITEVPDTPSFVRGVINLRGKVIPVIDVRHRFGLELREYDDRTCIIVVDYEETAVGLIVDTVNEVVDIPEDQIDPPPRARSGIDSSYIWGMGKIGKQVNILLNLGKVLFVEEILAKRRKLDD